MEATPHQPRLITGFCRCDDCGATVEQVRKMRRFRLCDTCWERVVPEIDTITAAEIGSPKHDAISRYWEWYRDMEARHPSRRRSPGKPKGEPPRPADLYFPLCDCGEQREEVRLAGGRPPGLFGGPFLAECPVCRARRAVEHHARATSWLHREWDDEEWLDLLYRVMPEAFALRVLPAYWFELRRTSVPANPGD